MFDLPAPSSTLSLGFVALSLVMLVFMIVVVARSAGRPVGLIVGGVLVVWAALTAGLAASGVLTHFEPPRVTVILMLEIVALVWLWRSESGARLAGLPLGVLVGFQGFRVLVELLIHQAVLEGIAPQQMTWTGWNFDIVTGVSALIVGPLAGRLPPLVVRAWNLVCAGILVVVLIVAMLSMPTPARVFAADPPNIWITQMPFVWLPAILVFAAFAGHVLTERHLRLQAARS